MSALTDCSNDVNILRMSVITFFRFASTPLADIINIRVLKLINADHETYSQTGMLNDLYLLNRINCEHCNHVNERNVKIVRYGVNSVFSGRSGIKCFNTNVNARHKMTLTSMDMTDMRGMRRDGMLPPVRSADLLRDRHISMAVASVPALRTSEVTFTFFITSKNERVETLIKNTMTGVLGGMLIAIKSEQKTDSVCNHIFYSLYYFVIQMVVVAQSISQSFSFLAQLLHVKRLVRNVFGKMNSHSNQKSRKNISTTLTETSRAKRGNVGKIVTYMHTVGPILLLKFFSLVQKFNILLYKPLKKFICVSPSEKRLHSSTIYYSYFVTAIVHERIKHPDLSFEHSNVWRNFEKFVEFCNTGLQWVPPITRLIYKRHERVYDAITQEQTNFGTTGKYAVSVQINIWNTHREVIGAPCAIFDVSRMPCKEIDQHLFYNRRRSIGFHITPNGVRMVHLTIKLLTKWGPATNFFVGKNIGSGVVSSSPYARNVGQSMFVSLDILIESTKRGHEHIYRYVQINENLVRWKTGFGDYLISKFTNKHGLVSTARLNYLPNCNAGHTNRRILRSRMFIRHNQIYKLWLNSTFICGKKIVPLVSSSVHRNRYPRIWKTLDNPRRLWCTSIHLVISSKGRRLKYTLTTLCPRVIKRPETATRLVVPIRSTIRLIWNYKFRKGLFLYTIFYKKRKNHKKLKISKKSKKNNKIIIKIQKKLPKKPYKNNNKKTTIFSAQNYLFPVQFFITMNHFSQEGFNTAVDDSICKSINFSASKMQLLFFINFLLFYKINLSRKQIVVLELITAELFPLQPLVSWSSQKSYWPITYDSLCVIGTNLVIEKWGKKITVIIIVRHTIYAFTLVKTYIKIINLGLGGLTILPVISLLPALCF